MTSPSQFRERLLERLAVVAPARPNDVLTSLLSERQIDQLQQYLELLRHWNRKINLTALPVDALGNPTIDRLFIEPLSAARLFGRGPMRWADFGSGGGSPAVPLKIACPASGLTMVESRGRKAAFLREVTRELGLSDVTVLGMRAEALETQSIEPFELITIRAVRVDEPFMTLIHRQTAAGGRLILFTQAESADAIDGFTRVDEVALKTTSSRIVVFQKG